VISFSDSWAVTLLTQLRQAIVATKQYGEMDTNVRQLRIKVDIIPLILW